MIIDTFLELIDKLITIVQSRETKKLRRFDEVFHPFFQELEKVVDDHLCMLRDAIRALESMDDSKIMQLVGEIGGKRDRLLTARIRVREFAQCVRGTMKEESVKQFFADANELFRATGESGQAFLSIGEELEKNVESLALTSNDRIAVLGTLRTCEERAQSHWKRVSRSFSQLMLEYKA